MVDAKPKGFRPDTLISIVLFVAVAGHIAGVWSIPRWPAAAPAAVATLDPHSITVAYSRALTNGVSPWKTDDMQRIMLRFVQRWSEATLGRSQVRVLEETELRDVLIVFNDVRVTTAEARTLSFAGGRIRYVEVYAQVLPLDVEFTAGTLLHEFGHVLGCCTGPGTSGGHFVGPNCQRILCVTHGSARTFSEDELRQMGLTSK